MKDLRDTLESLVKGLKAVSEQVKANDSLMKSMRDLLDLQTQAISEISRVAAEARKKAEAAEVHGRNALGAAGRALGVMDALKRQEGTWLQ